VGRVSGKRTALHTIVVRNFAWAPLVLVLVAFSGLACCAASGFNNPAGARMSGLGLVPHGIDVANALAVADAQSGGQKQLISGTQATIL
jgi:hypothetical protein